MLGKLTGPGDGYDAVCLLVVDWNDEGQVTVDPTKVPGSLAAETFFARMVEAVLERTPTYLHVAAREAREHRDLAMDEGDGE